VEGHVLYVTNTAMYNLGRPQAGGPMVRIVSSFMMCVFHRFPCKVCLFLFTMCFEGALSPSVLLGGRVLCSS
jgi:hypothetical protein